MITLKKDEHYFIRVKCNTEGGNGPSAQPRWPREKLADRETHFFHDLTETIITECVERGVGTLAVSWPKDVPIVW
jgi:hypothetical protein